jgi:hypothetical protein
MACEEDHIENAGVEESDTDESMNDEREEQESYVENEVNEEDNETDNDEDDEGGRVMEHDQDQELTDESEGDENTERCLDGRRDYRDRGDCMVWERRRSRKAMLETRGRSYSRCQNGGDKGHHIKKLEH